MTETEMIPYQPLGPSAVDGRRIFAKGQGDVPAEPLILSKGTAKAMSFMVPYIIGLLSGLALFYILTILVGYCINRWPDSSTLRKVYYSYMIGCQGP